MRKAFEPLRYDEEPAAPETPSFSVRRAQGDRDHAASTEPAAAAIGGGAKTPRVALIASHADIVTEHQHYFDRIVMTRGRISRFPGAPSYTGRRKALKRFLAPQGAS